MLVGVAWGDMMDAKAPIPVWVQLVAYLARKLNVFAAAERRERSKPTTRLTTS
jgi:hypothetical protein